MQKNIYWINVFSPLGVLLRWNAVLLKSGVDGNNGLWTQQFPSPSLGGHCTTGGLGQDLLFVDSHEIKETLCY